MNISKIEPTSKDLMQEYIEEISILLPELITEGKIDLEKFKTFFSLSEEESNERYRFTWHGKDEGTKHALKPPRGTLRPEQGESVDWGNTNNLFIKGDNLEVLKLLQKSYHSSVSVIYIDPPYNTGKEFIYPDKFKDNLDAYLKYTRQVDKDGFKSSTNQETSGRFHTNWLNMMYPRLKIARNLLKNDGVIFISIDDNEFVNLKKICDEIFGEENFISNFVVQSNPRGSQSKSQAAIVHEYILAYAKDISLINSLALPLNDRMIAEYCLNDMDGNYRLLGLRQRGGAWRREQRPSLFYPFFVNPKDGSVSLEKEKSHSIEVLPVKPTTGEDGSWRWSKRKVNEFPELIIAKKVQRNGSEVWDMYQKDYLTEDKETKLKTLIVDKEVNYQNGTKEVKALFNNKDYFDFPKPIFLLKTLIAAASKGKDILVMDFFAGSGSTAHAVMELNAEDQGDRSFIMVQLPEPIDSENQASKDGFETIADLSRERIKRAAIALKDNLKDYGVKSFCLDSTNIKEWDVEEDNIEETLFKFVTNIKDDRSEDDLLYEILLKYGLSLTLPIEEVMINKRKVYSIGLGSLIICLSDNIDIPLVEGIGSHKEKLNPETCRVVFKDSGFVDDNVKTNAIQILKQYGVNEIKSL